MKKVLIALFFLHSIAFGAERPTVIGSKIFTESYILSEIAAQSIETSVGAKVDRRFGIGNSGMLVEALKSGKIDLYSDYSGTLAETILKRTDLNDLATIKAELEKQGFAVSSSLGFNDTYALAVPSAFAEKYGMHKISDLSKKLRFSARAAFSYEFMQRDDGYKKLIREYNLQFDHLIQMEHALVYQAIDQNAVDLIEVYSTDANIKKFKLTVLEDDLKIFPEYAAVWITKTSFMKAHPDQWKALTALEGKIDLEEMQQMNAEADLKKESVSKIASNFLNHPAAKDDSRLRQILRCTQEHLFLVGISLLFSILIGIPLGVLASKHQRLGQSILIFSAVVQTIPTLALLCFLIPAFGIGFKPAIVALCLYSLLPVVLNTFTGIKAIDPKHIENAKAFGLDPSQILFKITLPLSSSMILTGLKTATIVSIGTATLAALIGAGGYGTLIVSGLSLNDIPTILAGAVPAALLALLTHMVFEALNLFVIPKGWLNR